MIIECGLKSTMGMQAKVFHAKNWLYLTSRAGNKVCIDLGTEELVRGQCHKAPGLSKEQIKKIAHDWKSQ